jgi:hypothetical protein
MNIKRRQDSIKFGRFAWTCMVCVNSLKRYRVRASTKGEKPMRLLKRKSNRLMILALVSAAFIPNLMSIVGCSGAAARVDIPKSVDELPPVDHMALEKSRKADIVIERGDTIELTYMAAIDTYKTLGPVTFLGVEPETRMLGLLSESGEKLAILSDAIQNIARIMDSGLSLLLLNPKQSPMQEPESSRRTPKQPSNKIENEPRSCYGERDLLKNQSRGGEASENGREEFTCRS